MELDDPEAGKNSGHLRQQELIRGDKTCALYMFSHSLAFLCALADAIGQETFESGCSPHARALRRPLLADGSFEVLGLDAVSASARHCLKLARSLCPAGVSVQHQHQY